MTIALLSAVLLAQLLLTAAVLLTRPKPAPAPTVDRVLADLVRERFVVTLLSGEAFDGLLEDADERTLVMVAVSAVHSDGQLLPIDGRLLLRREHVAYLQRP